MPKSKHSPKKGGAKRAGKLLRIVHNSWIAHAATVAAEMGIADLLAAGAKTAEDLAQATGCHASSMIRFLRALASLDICRERPDGSFELTPMGGLLRTDSADSVRSAVIWWGRHLSPLWEKLRQAIETGAAVRESVTGSGGFSGLEGDFNTASLFHRAMAELTRMAVHAILEAYDFKGIGRIVDVGGGYGELLAAILRAHPPMRGILFDLPHAARGAARRLKEAEVAGRCEIVEGSFFEALPAGADAYLLKSVIHDWDDEQAGAVLGNCRRAMSAGARLILVERLLPDRIDATKQGQAIARADLNMLLAHGARERTEKEFDSLLRAHGFKTTRSIPTSAGLQILEAAPA